MRPPARGIRLIVVWLLAVLPMCAQARLSFVTGRVLDPQSEPVAGLRVLLFGPRRAAAGYAVTDEKGRFSFSVRHAGSYTVKVNAPGFQQVSEKIEVHPGAPTIADIHLGKLAAKQESITVTADVKDSNILFPDPAQRVYVRQEILDANPAGGIRGSGGETSGRRLHGCSREGIPGRAGPLVSPAPDGPWPQFSGRERLHGANNGNIGSGRAERALRTNRRSASALIYHRFVHLPLQARTGSLRDAISCAGWWAERSP